MGQAEKWRSARCSGRGLLDAVEEVCFRLFVTTDRNLRYQQNLAYRRIAIIVLGQQQWPQLRLHVQRIVDAVNAITPGSYIEVDVAET